MKELLVSKVSVETVLGATRLVMWAPTASGCYESGFDCIQWTGVQLQRENYLQRIPHTTYDCHESIDRSWPTKEVVADVFGRPGWKGEPIYRRLEKLIESGTDLSLLLPGSRRHMPIYFAKGNRLLAVWDGSTGAILLVEELPESCKNFYQAAFANTRRQVA